jgi:hypothetical protein
MPQLYDWRANVSPGSSLFGTAWIRNVLKSFENAVIVNRLPAADNASDPGLE